MSGFTLEPVARFLGGVGEWGILAVGIVGILAAGVSIPAALSALVAWLLIGLLTAVTPWRNAIAEAAAVLCAIWFPPSAHPPSAPAQPSSPP